MTMDDLAEEKLRFFAGYLAGNRTIEEITNAYNTKIKFHSLDRKEGLTKVEDIKMKIDLDVALGVLVLNEKMKETELMQNNPEERKRIMSKRRANRRADERVEKRMKNMDRYEKKAGKGPGLFKVLTSNIWYYLFFIEPPTGSLFLQNLIIFGGLSLISVFAQIALSTCLALGFALGSARLYSRGLDEQMAAEAQDPNKKSGFGVKVVPLVSALCIMIGSGYLGGLLATVAGPRLGLRLTFNALCGLCTNIMFFLSATFLWVQPAIPEVEELDREGKKIPPKLSKEEQKRQNEIDRAEANDW
jgi:hypothetical protein